jgi:hypothetical protein
MIWAGAQNEQDRNTSFLHILYEQGTITRTKVGHITSTRDSMGHLLSRCATRWDFLPRVLFAINRCYYEAFSITYVRNMATAHESIATRHLCGCRAVAGSLLRSQP